MATAKTILQELDAGLKKFPPELQTEILEAVQGEIHLTFTFFNGLRRPAKCRK